MPHKMIQAMKSLGLIAVMILSAPSSVLAQTAKIDDETLRSVIKSGAIESLQSLWADIGLTANSADSKGRALLRLAVEYKQLDMLKYLLAQGADINQPSADGQTALHVAAYSKDIRLVKFLLSQGADPNFLNHYDETPLYSAAFYGHSDIVLLMLQHGGRLDIENKEGHVALTHAPAILVTQVNEYLNNPASYNNGNAAVQASQANQNTQANQNAQANNLTDKIRNLSVEYQLWQQQHLVDNQDWIARISTGKKKELQELKDLLTQAGVTLIGGNNADFAFKITMKRHQSLTPSPLASFIPAFENLQQNNLLLTLASGRANVGIGQYLDLFDWQIQQDDVQQAADNNITTLTQKQANKLKATRKRNIDAIQALFFYDALVLMAEQFRLLTIKYDVIAQNLMIELDFYHQSFNQTFVTETIAEAQAQSWIENSANIEWDIMYDINAKGFQATGVIFRNNDETLQASDL